MAFSISSRMRFLHNMMFSKTNKYTTTAAAAAVVAAKMIGFMQFPHYSEVILSRIYLFLHH